jgi:hypothetical protein
MKKMLSAECPPQAGQAGKALRADEKETKCPFRIQDFI